MMRLYLEGSEIFERFTERARQVVILAQDEARDMRHTYIGTEHVLLGLLREEDSLAAKVLDSLDLTSEEVRQQILRIVGKGDDGDPHTAQIPFTPRAKKVFELALREALSLGHNYIGTEHILLGLVRENEGVAARILLDFDAGAEKVRNEVIRMLSGPRKEAQEKKQTEVKINSLADTAETLNRVTKALERSLTQKKTDTALVDFLTQATKTLHRAELYLERRMGES